MSAGRRWRWRAVAVAAGAAALAVTACGGSSRNAPWTPPPTLPTGWSAAASMPGPREGARAVALADGRVLLAGGDASEGRQRLADALQYDPATNAWTAVAGPPLTTFLSTMVQLQGGDVLAIGITSTGSTRTELYDPATRGWTETSGPAIVQGAALTALADGRALLCGGTGPDGEASATAALFDPAGLRWSPAAPMATARSDAAAVRLDDGRVLVVGGSGTGPVPNAVAAVEAFDPATGRWSAAASTHARLVSPSAVLMADGSVVVGSGMPIQSDTTQPAGVQRYDPGADRWTVVGRLNAGLHQPAVALSASQVLFVGIGGTSELFDTRSGRGAAVSPPYGLTDGNVFGPAMAPLGQGRILLAGGTLMRSGGHGLFVGTGVVSEAIAAAFVYDCGCSSGP